MLAIFKNGLVNPPQELKSPVSPNSSNPKLPGEVLNDFKSLNSGNALSICFGDSACLAYAPSQLRYSIHQRLFCGLDDIHCIFLGSLNNMSSLIKQYGLSKNTNEAMLVIEAYRTLRDRGPYPADRVIKDLDGSYGFVIYDHKAGTVFAAQGENEGVKLFWGIAADGSVVVSDNLDLIKSSCAKSFAPFPAGCMFHGEKGLMSYEHPTSKMKAMPRVDSQGIMCGANFKVDIQSTVKRMPRVGSEADWTGWN